MDLKLSRRFLKMLNDILQKDFILENGTEFEEHLEYGGPYELAIVEYTPDGNEKLFTGLAYDKYENGNIESYFYVEQGVKQGKCVEFYSNGNVKKIGNMNKSAADGYQVEFFENGNRKYESEYIAGREMTYIKYDKNGNIVEQKAEPDESDLKYVEKFND
ncbi:morn repeat protein [Bacillus stratosphericus LAMA 585]|nr:morn repeat protein [Bacillus stratosphericus LAMA 585]